MLTVDVPLNTMLADLDETLRNLLREDLERHGFEGVDIAFDAPARDWSGQLSKPTVNLFLYDLREAETLRTSEWSRVKQDGRTFESRPPMVIECSYAVTAWTQAVEDEHRLLSQVLAILFAYPQLPQERLNGRLANGSQPFPIKGRIGQGKGEKSDFWSAVGGQYKVSLDYVVRLSVESGAKRERGPEVRTQTVRTSLEGSARTVLEMHRSVGRVRNKKGTPLRDVWITLPDVGTWASSNADGRFTFNRLPPGTHRLLARTIDGREAVAQLEVPGNGVELVIDGKG
ncbi:MAG TPA: Pvc16 family protein [Solirubrobacter sp.]|nr:Pvc16 family protein [Solirubrobacter sp.]